MEQPVCSFRQGVVSLSPIESSNEVLRESFYLFTDAVSFHVISGLRAGESTAYNPYRIIAVPIL